MVDRRVDFKRLEQEHFGTYCKLQEYVNVHLDWKVRDVVGRLIQSGEQWNLLVPMIDNLYSCSEEPSPAEREFERVAHGLRDAIRDTLAPGLTYDFSARRRWSASLPRKGTPGSSGCTATTTRARMTCPGRSPARTATGSLSSVTSTSRRPKRP